MTDIYQNNGGPLRLTERHMIEPSLPRVTLKFPKRPEITGKLLAINKEFIGISHYVSLGICDIHKIEVFQFKDLSSIVSADDNHRKQINNLFSNKEGLLTKIKNKLF